ncbi:MAG TPA: PfkB family carbohydrate kinase [Kofleriaceae bacterium]|jgi:fructokinase|nr:PfkB family carbohydrate kinase [Kofleriaceae bacterium]
MSIGSDQAVVIWGEVLWDRFPDGHRLGGAPANVAWHLGQAGGWARLVSRVGADADGQRAIDELSQVCDADLVQIDAERATGEVLVEIGPDREPRYTLVPNRAWERIECTADVKGALAEAGVLVYGTLSQHADTGIASWREAIASATCLKVCDINLRRLSRSPDEERRAAREAIAAADIVKVNDQELARLAEWFSWRDPLAALREGKRILAVTHGARGATLYGEDRVVEIAGVPALPGGDNVGCGDAFIAILIHGMTLGWDLEMSGRAAARWASAVAGVRGATPLFDDERIDELLGAPREETAA